MTRPCPTRASQHRLSIDATIRLPTFSVHIRRPTRPAAPPPLPPATLPPAALPPTPLPPAALRFPPTAPTTLASCPQIAQQRPCPALRSRPMPLPLLFPPQSTTDALAASPARPSPTTRHPDVGLGEAGGQWRRWLWMWSGAGAVLLTTTHTDRPIHVPKTNEERARCSGPRARHTSVDHAPVLRRSYKAVQKNKTHTREPHTKRTPLPICRNASGATPRPPPAGRVPTRTLPHPLRPSQAPRAR